MLTCFYQDLQWNVLGNQMKQQRKLIKLISMIIIKHTDMRWGGPCFGGKQSAPEVFFYVTKVAVLCPCVKKEIQRIELSKS